MTAWPLFEVTVRGREPAVIAARSRSAASYSSFLRFSDVWNCTFREWLNLVSVRKMARPLDDAYAYVRRNYDRDLRHGTRVAITGEGRDLEGRLGTVVHPGRDSTAYAHVVLDGTDHVCIVHPYSVVIQTGVPETGKAAQR